MPFKRERNKKLIVAFHFLRAEAAAGERAGWKCEPCRRLGLERRRRCGFLRETERGAARVVWARGRIGTEECPISFITPASTEFIEKYFAWKMTGCADLTARDAEAFMILEAEMRREERNGR